MLLTPHILRAPEITEADLRPIYIGSQGNLGLERPAAAHWRPAAASRSGSTRCGDPAGASAPRSPATAPAPHRPGQPSPPPGTTLARAPGIDTRTRDRCRAEPPAGTGAARTRATAARAGGSA